MENAVTPVRKMASAISLEPTVRPTYRAVSVLLVTVLSLSCRDLPTSENRSFDGAPPRRDLIAIMLPRLTDFVEISTGGQNSCVRQFGGDVYCWGLNQNYEAGDPDRTFFCGTDCITAPTRVVSGAIQIAVGSSHSCALSSTYRAYCWGLGSAGETGLGAPSSQSLPQAVTGGLTFSSISAGQGNSCAVSSGDIYCWGSIVGNASQPVRLTSVGIYESVSVSQNHGCALAAYAGLRETHCWGQNESGETSQDPLVLPFEPPTLNTAFGTAVSRVATIGGYAYSVTVGPPYSATRAEFTCVDQQSGYVSCVGAADKGQLGNGAPMVAHSYQYQPQTVSILAPVLTRFGYVYKSIPLALHGTTVADAHACALDANGAAYCWGDNMYGQLGTGDTVSSNRPRLVAGGHAFRAISTARTHTCAIGTDNVIYCWGTAIQSFGNGQLGLGTKNEQSYVPVATLPPVVHAAIPIV
jgi:alpha-tubulin suppressor-like RCC1 family protein